MSALLDAALYYARDLKWPVFPVARRGKLPLIPRAHGRDEPPCRGECGRDGHGLHDATTNPGRVTAWWERWSDANIGLRTAWRSTSSTSTGRRGSTP